MEKEDKKEEKVEKMKLHKNFTLYYSINAADVENYENAIKRIATFNTVC